MADPIALTVQEESQIRFAQEQIAIVKAVSPTVETEQTETGAKITITDLNGPHTVYVYDGRGIASVVLNADYTLTITYTDGNSYTTPSIRGADGRGIVSIEKTGTSGLVDTYTITYTDGAPSTLTITNGKDGQDGVTFTPSVSAAGVISWSNDGGRQNPEPVNIKGPQGEQGPQGDDYVLTSQDKDDIVNAVLAVYPAAEGVSF